MTTPNQPQDPYSSPEGSGQQPGGLPSYPGGSDPAQGGQAPQYGQYGDPNAGQYASGGQFGGGPSYPGYQGYGAPAGPPPQNYLVWAILTTVLCCLPLGVVSIVFSSQVNSKWNAGDQAGAIESSRKAKTWAIWSAAVGLAFSVIYIILVVTGAVTAGFSTSSY